MRPPAERQRRFFYRAPEYHKAKVRGLLVDIGELTPHFKSISLLDKQHSNYCYVRLLVALVLSTRRTVVFGVVEAQGE